MNEKLWWIKNGGGTFRLKDSKKIIKPGQKFEATVDQIPEAFRDVVKPLSELPEEKPLESETKFETKERTEEAGSETPEENETTSTDNETQGGEGTEGTENATAGDTDTGEGGETQPEGEKSAHKVEPRGSGWYDVINGATGKPINESGLRKDKAEELLNSLF